MRLNFGRLLALVSFAPFLERGLRNRVKNLETYQEVLAHTCCVPIIFGRKLRRTKFALQNSCAVLFFDAREIFAAPMLQRRHSVPLKKQNNKCKYTRKVHAAKQKPTRNASEAKCARSGGKRTPEPHVLLSGIIFHASAKLRRIFGEASVPKLRRNRKYPPYPTP
jgi:hypothetical protein